MDWATYVTTLQTMLQVQDASGVANLNAILPRFVDSAELRMYRDPDLDFLATRTTDRTQITTGTTRDVPIPAAFVVVEDVALIYPAGAQPGVAGAKRIPLQRVQRGFIDTIWPQETQTQAPDPTNMVTTYWAIFTQEETPPNNPPAVPQAGIASAASSIIIGPTPDGQYVTEFRGTFRPPSFYTVAGFDPTTGHVNDGTAQTFLSQYMPDLFLAASMIFGAAWQKNFSAMAENPQTAVSWLAEYERLKTPAAVEEARKRHAGADWTAYGPPIVANLPFTGRPPAPPQGPQG